MLHIFGFFSIYLKGNNVLNEYIKRFIVVFFVIIKGTKCPLGYVGRYCDEPCQFPYYGVACQKTCACSSKQCNFTSGCQSINASKLKSYHSVS